MSYEDVAKPDFVVVVGQHNLAVSVFAKSIDVRKLTLTNSLPPLAAADNCTHDHLAVQPVLNPISADDDATVVELANRFQVFVRIRVVNVIE